ncbi:MAG TPA: gamma carbonic anhydrase family protein [Chitinophagales bacterium]|nr:gamma carbonic anhydrase family protein [Chitinophagales bacterium]
MENRYFELLKSKVKTGNNVFIAPGAIVIGDVQLGDNVSVWYQAVLRGDNDTISVGCRTNIQDGAIVHVDPGVPVSVGEDNVVGHGAVLHGCTIGNNNLIGMRVTILNNARIGNCCIIGANTLITENTVIPDYSMVLGSPGKIVKQLPAEVKDMILLGVHAYIEKARQYLAGGKDSGAGV